MLRKLANEGTKNAAGETIVDAPTATVWRGVPVNLEAQGWVKGSQQYMWNVTSTTSNRSVAEGFASS